MPNPSGINQYSSGGSGGGDKRDSGAGNSHPDHMSAKEKADNFAANMKAGKSEGYSVKGSRHSDR